MDEEKSDKYFRILLAFLAFILILTGAEVAWFKLIKPATFFVQDSGEQKNIIQTVAPEVPAAEEIKKATTTLMFVGDIMLSRAVGDKMKKLNDWNWPFEKIAEYLVSADLLFGNLEGPISARGRNVGSEYSFRADPDAVEGLKYAGFDVLSVANNHIGDWTKDAMEDTFAILKKNGIEHAGAGANSHEAHSAKIKEVNGIKFGFLAYTALGAKYTEAQASSSGVAWLDKEKMIEDITEAKKSSDVLIVSLHFGEEYKQKSNLLQQDIAHAAIDAGASLVIGHHPHVVEEAEQYRGGFIAYSLGNFIFDQSFSKETMQGLLLKVSFEGMDIKNIEPVSINISREFQASVGQ
jgi:poly-gamma-glutamate synthesis protein (capsule biosynthesis protein)